jgi:hypothetical protein
MKKAEIRAFVLAVLLLLGGIAAIVYWLFGDMITRGARVENLDAYVARALAAATAGRLADPLQAAVGDRYHDAKNVAHDVTDFFAAAPSGRFETALVRTTPFPAPVAAVDLDQQRYDAIRNELPDGARADTLDAARTIAFIRCRKEKVGSYGHIFSQDAYKQVCSLLAVDMGASAGPTILAMETFESQPPQKVDLRFRFGDIVAARPYELWYYVVESLKLTNKPGS